MLHVAENMESTTNVEEVGFRRPKHKKRRRLDIQTDKLQIYEDLQTASLYGMLIDSAVWVCTSAEIVAKLDSACFGNLDGGLGTAQHIKKLLDQVDVPSEGNKAVRLSLDEAFFMHYALRALTVFELRPQGEAALALDTPTLWRRLQEARSDFTILYMCYHHFRSKVGRGS